METQRERHRLELLGITYNQIESGVYAVILREIGGERRLPIVIGYPEAQSIECKLQDVVTPRPLTHDMMLQTMQEFGLELTEIEIRQTQGGTFTADLYITDGLQTRIIDARSSDGLALAVRAKAPIYIQSDLLDAVGIIPEKQNSRPRSAGRQQRSVPKAAPSEKKLKQLQDEMQKAAENEDYERAAALKAEIERLKNIE